MMNITSLLGLFDNVLGNKMNLFGRKSKADSGGKKRVLIVDDHPNIITLYKYMLEKENFQVLVANDGDQALRVAEDGNPDIVLLDIMMPGISGLDVLHALKRSNPSLPIILHSANPSAKEDFDSVIADAFLEKGTTSPKQVLEKIRELLAQPAN